MSATKTFIFSHKTARALAAEFCMSAPDLWMVRFSEPKRKNIQSDKFHAMIGDISKQCTFMGKKWNQDDWKRFLVDAFAKVMRDDGTPLHHDGRIVPSLDGERVVQLGIQTAEFRVKEASDFIEYLFSWGAENNVVWTDRKSQGWEP